jgi:hypothetical protein
MSNRYFIIAFILGIIAAFFYWRNLQDHAHEGHDGHNHGAVELKSQDNQALLKEVMDIHDEVMPKMGYMASLQQKFREMAANSKDKALKDQYLSMSVKLEKADEAMMVWMEEFPENIEQYSTEEARTILTKEKEKVVKMKAQILTAIQESENFITPK